MQGGPARGPPLCTFLQYRFTRRANAARARAYAAPETGGAFSLAPCRIAASSQPFATAKV